MSTVQDIQNSICDAMNILADNAVTKSNATITLECKIIEIIDVALGLYKVKYLDNQFEVYSNPNITYNTDDIVYVLVPDGDLDKTKTIIGGVAPSASMYISEASSENYVPISDNLFTNINDIELCSYNSESRRINFDDNDVPIFNMVISDYIDKYKTFLFNAKIKTQIPFEQQQGGNYGLILNLPFLKLSSEDGQITMPIWKTISIDINNIQGNPYILTEYSLQNIYFEIEEGEIYDTAGTPDRSPFITAFVQDFAQDETKTTPDIFIKDIDLRVIDVLTVEEKQGYSLTIVASQGNYFLNNKYETNKILIPHLKINGKDKKINNYDCYWFVEDSSVTPIVEGYSSLGGIGWRCLNNKINVNYNEDGRSTYQYATNIYQLLVKQEDVVYNLRYKCVLIKNDIIVNGIINIKNLNNNIQTQLISVTGLNNFVKDTGYINLISRIYYPGIQNNIFETAWQRFDKFGNYLGDNFYNFVRVNDPIEIDGKIWYETEIEFPCSIVDSFNTINCSFYSIDINNNKQNLGTSSILINTVDNFNYKIIIQNGDVVYKYDADGDSPKSADYDGPLTSTIKQIPPLSFKIYKNDGTELTETEYLYCKTTWKVPKNSMIKLSSQYTLEDEQYYYIEGQGQIDVYYDIINTYNVKKNDNNVFLTVEFNDNILNEVANIKFLKDGESGTNGSKYTAIIKYDGHGYGEKDADGNICKLHCIAKSNLDGTQKEWGLLDYKTGLYEKWLNDNNPQLTVSVYCNGELITNTAEYSVNWSFFDSLFLDTDFNITNGILSQKLQKKYNVDIAIIIQAQITVGNIGTTNSQEVIYAYYPIETSFVTTNQNLYGSIIPSIEGGFDKVLYAADGTNPKYDNTNTFVYNDNLNEETEQVQNYYTYTWSSLSENLDLKTEGNASSAQFKAKTKFDNGITNNGIKLVLTPNNNSPAEKMSELLEEIAFLEARQSYYDNITINLDTFINLFNYNNLLDELNNIKVFLNYRYNLITYVDQLQNELKEIVDYCIKQEINPSIFDYVNYNLILTEAFNNLREKLYNLGRKIKIDDEYYYIELSDLNNLDNAKILISETTFKETYGISIFEILNSLIISYNNSLQKYKNVYASLMSDTTSEEKLIAFRAFEEEIIENIIESNALQQLSTEYKEGTITFEPQLDFVILKKQMIDIGERFWTIEDKCNSYDSISIYILNEMQSLFTKYGNPYYNQYYTNEMNLSRAELTLKRIKYNDYSKMVFEGNEGDSIIHIKPIVLLFNRYELSNINGWDGSKLYIDDSNTEEPQYLLAPQIGAGLKTNNKFTGTVMGIKKLNANSGIENHIGLFAFDEGEQTYFLNAKDGSVIMGKSGGGQIIADPSQNKALLYSGVFFKEYKTDGKPTSYGTSNWKKEGMLIDLTTPEIRFGNGNFVLNSNGHITAAGGGSIAGWNIDDTSISSKISVYEGRLVLDSGAIVEGTNAKGEKIYTASTPGKIYSGNHSSLNSTSKGFYLSQDGLSICNGVRSRIELSTEGDPEIFSGGHSSLTDTSNGFYLGNDGLSIGSKVYISDEGILRLGWGAVKKTGKYWTIDGTTDNSSISYVDTNDDSMSVYIGTNEIRLGKKIDGSYPFRVTNKGILYAKNASIQGKIEASSGQIGSWHIQSDGSLKGYGDYGELTLEASSCTIRGDYGYIDLQAEAGGDLGGIHFNANAVVFSCNRIGVTEGRSGYGIYNTYNGWLTDQNGNNFYVCHGLITSNN